MLMPVGGPSLHGIPFWFPLPTAAYGVDANKANIIQESYRNAAWILGWVNTGLFAATLTLGSLVAFGKLGGGLQQPQSTSMGYTSGGARGSVGGWAGAGTRVRDPNR